MMKMIITLEEEVIVFTKSRDILAQVYSKETMKVFDEHMNSCKKLSNTLKEELSTQGLIK